MKVCEVLSRCERTECRSELLHDLLNGDAKRHFPPRSGAIDLLANGHSRLNPTRQVLCYIFRRALNIVRLPGTFDVRMHRGVFEHFDPAELESAVEDARRIYEFGQREMKRVWAEPTLPLRRGIQQTEASVAKYLFDEIDGEAVPFYFSTFTFFNFKGGAFNTSLKIACPCPIEWIWASQYTLSDLDKTGSCEEFIVTCLDPSGFMELPRKAFEFADSFTDIEPIKVTGIDPYDPTGAERHRVIGHALAILAHEGIEPDRHARYQLEYESGRWERRIKSMHRSFVRFGRMLDRRFSSSLFQSRVHTRIDNS